MRIADEQNIAMPHQMSDEFLKKIETYYPHMNATQKYIFYVLSRSAMNMILRVYERPDIITQLESQVPVFSVIL